MLSLFVYNNNAQATLAVGIDEFDTDLLLHEAVPPFNDPRGVPVAHGAPISGGPAARLTLVDNIVSPTKIEIVSLEHTTDPNPPGQKKYIISRGLEGTAAQAWPAGSYAIQALTRGMLNPPQVKYEVAPMAVPVNGKVVDVSGALRLHDGVIWPAAVYTSAASILDAQVASLGVTSSLNVTGGMRVSGGVVPTTSSDTGSPGDIRWNSSYLFICVGGNNWKRVALSSF